jgi:hypothetical protein
MRVPFESLLHFVIVPVTLNGVETHFILDSGIGPTFVRDHAAAVPTGETVTGKRMSGQEVAFGMGHVERLEFGGYAVADAEVALLDMNLPPELDHIGGIFGLTFFSTTPLTVDYPGRTVYVGSRDGASLDVALVHEARGITMQLPLTLPTGESIPVELDMGSDRLILDERFVALGAGEREVVEDVDETGHSFTRTFFERLPGRIHLTDAPELAQDDPPVMFQKIIYDGLLGTDFLKSYAVTFDAPGSRIVLS